MTDQQAERRPSNSLPAKGSMKVWNANKNRPLRDNRVRLLPDEMWYQFRWFNHEDVCDGSTFVSLGRMMAFCSQCRQFYSVKVELA